MTMIQDPNELHSVDGLHFLRLEDGSVRIRLAATIGNDTHKEAFRSVLKPSEWASVVASCCGRGADHLTHGEAEAYHMKSVQSAEGEWEAVEQYIQDLKQSYTPDTPQETQTLVGGNIRGFYAWLRGGGAAKREDG